MPKIKITDKNTEASREYLQEWERVDRLNKQYIQKQAEAKIKLEKLNREMDELNSEIISALDPVKVEQLSETRRNLRLAIEDQDLLANKLDVREETRKHMHAIKQSKSEADAEFTAFRLQANEELAGLKKNYEADVAAVEALLAEHPYAQAEKMHISLLNRVRKL